MKPEDITISFVTLERPNFLRLSLESVSEFPNLLVFDNGTKDVTKKLSIRAISLKNKAKYLRSEENGGLMQAWNECIRQSTTEWVCVCPDDVVFRYDWFEDLNSVLEKKPWIKMVFGNNYDCIILHKSVLKTVGEFPEEYKQYPSSEDYEIHLRLTKLLGYTPYCWPGDHIQGPDRIRRLEVAAKASENYFREDNFTFWFTYPQYKPLCIEIRHKKDGASYAIKNPNVKTGQQIFNEKWELCEENDEGALLNIDCLYYRERK